MMLSVLVKMIQGSRALNSIVSIIALLFLFSCTVAVSNNSQSEKLRKRALRNQAKLGLAFLYQVVGGAEVTTKEQSLKAFETLIQEDGNVSHDYEYGWLVKKEDLSKTWLSPGPIENSLAWKNYDILKNLCPHCGLWDSGMILMAVGNLDADPDLDVWTMDQSRIFVHVMED